MKKRKSKFADIAQELRLLRVAISSISAYAAEEMYARVIMGKALLVAEEVAERGRVDAPVYLDVIGRLEKALNVLQAS